MYSANLQCREWSEYCSCVIYNWLKWIRKTHSSTMWNCFWIVVVWKGLVVYYCFEGETCITLRKADIRIRWEIWKTRSCLQAASYEGIRMYTNELKTFLRLDALETLWMENTGKPCTRRADIKQVRINMQRFALTGKACIRRAVFPRNSNIQRDIMHRDKLFPSYRETLHTKSRHKPKK